MQQSTAKDTSVAVGNDSMSTSSGIYLDDNTATQRKTQTNGGRPKRTRLTMVMLWNQFTEVVHISATTHAMTNSFTSFCSAQNDDSDDTNSLVF